jgi:hypothetical protein
MNIEHIIKVVEEGGDKLNLISETVNSQEIEKPIYADYKVVYTFPLNEEETVIRKIIEKQGHFLYIESDLCADAETTGNCTLEYDKVYEIL